MVWISDVHLGFRGCSAEYLPDFLRSTECEYLHPVGDTIDEAGKGPGNMCRRLPGDMMQPFRTASPTRACRMPSGERSEATDRDY